MAQCTAKSKRTGNRCRDSAMVGKAVCYHHGGKSPQGVAHYNLKDGRHSKHLPTRMAAAYRDSRQDADLLALRDDIALIDSRLLDVLGRVDTGESGRMWLNLKAAHQDMLDARAAQDNVALVVALARIGDLISHGAADHLAWGEIVLLIERRRKLVESEQKRLVAMQSMISTERAMLWLGAVTDIIRENVTDRETLVRIADALGRLVPRESSP